MKDGKSVEVINTNDKNVLVDQSEKPAMHYVAIEGVMHI